MAGKVERLAGAIKLVGKAGAEELVAGAPGAVQHHHRIIDLPLGVAVRRAERGDVNFHFGQLFAVRKSEVLEDDVAFAGLFLPVFGMDGLRGEGEGREGREDHAHVDDAIALPRAVKRPTQAPASRRAKTSTTLLPVGSTTLLATIALAKSEVMVRKSGFSASASAAMIRAMSSPVWP